MKRKIKKWVAELIGLFVVLLGVTMLSFSLMYIAPGDPARTILQAGGTMPSEEAVQEKRKEMTGISTGLTRFISGISKNASLPCRSWG